MFVILFPGFSKWTVMLFVMFSVLYFLSQYLFLLLLFLGLLHSQEYNSNLFYLGINFILLVL